VAENQIRAEAIVPVSQFHQPPAFFAEVPDGPLLYLKMDSEGKWGQVTGNIVSEWTQLLGVKGGVKLDH